MYPSLIYTSILCFSDSYIKKQEGTLKQAKHNWREIYMVSNIYFSLDMCVFFFSSLLYINNVVSKTSTHNYTERLEIECTPQSCTVLDIPILTYSAM